MSLAFQPGDNGLAVVDYAQASLLDSYTGEELVRYRLPPNIVFARIAFDASGERVLVAIGASCETPGCDMAIVFDARTGKELNQFVGHTDYVMDATFVGEDLLATASADGTGALWDLGTGKQLAVLLGHSQLVIEVAASPDGRYVATVSAGEIRVWDRAGELIETIPFGGFVGWLDGQTLLVGTRVYRCEVCAGVDALVELAKSRLTRELTPEERATYLSG